MKLKLMHGQTKLCRVGQLAVSLHKTKSGTGLCTIWLGVSGPTLVLIT